MPKYSKEEVEAFKKKDQLNARQSALKAASINNEGGQKPAKSIIKEAELYYDWLYPKDKEDVDNEIPTNTSGVAGDKDGNDCSEAGQPCWAEIAEELNLAIPNEENVKILNLLINEYKQTKKASANPSTILTHIIRSFGRYPTKMESVGVILNSLNKE